VSDDMVSSAAIKAADAAVIDYVLQPFSFLSSPMEHQARCLVWSVDKEKVAYWLDVGTGKTWLALYTALTIWGCKNVLVVCPNPVIDSWKEQIEEHTDFKYSLLTGTKAQRLLKQNMDTPLHIINYEGLQTLWGKKVQKLVIEKGVRRKVNKTVVDDFAVLSSMYDCIVVDEVHRCKNPKALVTLLCRALGKHARYAIVMTGTPLTRDQRDLWAEFSVLDNGATLGTNYWAYVNTYFKKRGFDWVLRKGSLEKILSRVSDKTIRYERQDCFDLPERTYETLNIRMTTEQAKLTDELIDKARDEVESGKNQAALMTLCIKLAQVTGGFLIVDGVTKRLNSNPKLRALEKLIDEIDGKFIIYHQFVEEGRMIEGMLRRLKVPFKSVRSEVKNKPAQIREFREDKNVRVLVAHPACGGEGINLQFASTIVYYSNSFNMIHREQSEGRIYRAGQTRKCVYFDLLVGNDENDSIDYRIMQALGSKKQIAQVVLDYVRGNNLKDDK